MTGNLFTPRLASTDTARAQMELNDSDYAKIGRGCEWQADITDQKTGKRYRVRGADCGAGRCFCDAVILRCLPAVVR